VRLNLGERDAPVIVFTVGGREQYLVETLKSWRKVRGIENATLIFRVEPGHPNALETCFMSSPFAETTMVIENKSRLGVAGNPWRAMQTGFRLADFVILAEEDTPVSTDVLEYFAWARGAYEHAAMKRTVLAVCAHQIGEPLGGEGDVLQSRHFSPVVWGTWAGTWQELLRDRWGGPAGWDFQVNKVMEWTGANVVIPARSRSQHIGEYGGAHCTPDYFPHTVSRSWQAEYGPQSYRELARVQQEEGK
jgi:hypothetical protein